MQVSKNDAIRLDNSDMEALAVSASSAALFEVMPLGVVYQDAAGRITDANPAAAQILGIPLAELKGKTQAESLGRVVYEDGRDFPPDEYPSALALRTGQPVRGVVIGLFAPGGSDPRWVRLRAIPVFSPASSTPVQVFTMIEDITAHRFAEQESQSWARQVTSILESTTDIFFAFDHEWRYTYINVQAERVANCSRADLLGRTLWEVFPAVVGTPVEAAYRRAMDERVATEVSAYIAEFDVMLELRAFPTTDGMTVYGRDISERHRHEDALRRERDSLRRSEARLAEAQCIAHVGSWEVDMATGMRMWSEELSRIWGRDPAEGPPSACDIRASYHPEDQPRYDQMAESLSRFGSPREMVARVMRPDGKMVWCKVQGRAVHSDDGRIVRLIGTVADITESKALEAERERLLEETERLLSEARERADRDPLTGLLNHRAYHSRLAEEAARCQSDGSLLALVLVDINNFQFFNDVYGHLAGDDLLRAAAQRLYAALAREVAVARFGGDEFALLIPQAEFSTAVAVEAQVRKAFGAWEYLPSGAEAPIPITVSLGGALFPFFDQDLHEALHYAEKRLLRAKTGGDDETEADRVRAAAAGTVTGFSMLDALVTAVDNKDRYTRHHSEDVLAYSLMIARHLGMDAATQKTVAVAALLHDVGKIGVPDAILRKPARLSDEEYEAVKQHPQMGAIMVTAVPGLEDTLAAVRHHHERWDGEGYPFGLRGEETPLIARLMAIADAFSAMTTDRPYRKGMSPQRALQILREGAGTQWDPVCVQAFLAAWNAQVLETADPSI